MAFVDDGEHPDGRIVGLYVGVVVDNIDPSGVGRVRIRVPGLLEPASSWALPLGTLGGGTDKRGHFFVPEIGAEVGVFFNQGDVDYPYYLSAHWGWSMKNTDDGTEAPTLVKDVPVADRPKVKAIETERFLILIDDRKGSEEDPQEGKERLLITYKDDPENFIELDGLNRGITISGTTGVRIASTGIVSIEGGQVQINGRRVNDLSTGDI